jgi:hypothetical protein
MGSNDNIQWGNLFLYSSFATATAAAATTTTPAPVAATARSSGVAVDRRLGQTLCFKFAVRCMTTVAAAGDKPKGVTREL